LTQALVTLFRVCSKPLRQARLLRFVALCLCAVTLSACKVDLYTNLDQRQANEMVAILLQHGISAERANGKNGQTSVTVEESRFADAIDILNARGLPKQEFATLGDVFKKDGLISSPVQERAQMIFALSQELSRTVSDIDGVVSARVHLVLPENDPLRQQLLPSSASVFIRHRPGMPVAELVPQVKMLVANGVAGLSYDKVSVILVPAQPQTTAEVDDRRAASAEPASVEHITVAGLPTYGIGALATIIAVALGLFLWQRRQRVYALRSDE
jgi:type III secretion protein J